MIFLHTHTQANAQIIEKETEMGSLREAAGLFEVNIPEFKQLKACRREIALLKSLWDMIMLVKSSFSDWNTTLWKDINVEQMEIECKKFVKDIRSLDKEMRAWNAFTGKNIYIIMYIYACVCDNCDTVHVMRGREGKREQMQSLLFLYNSLGMDSTVKNMVTSLRSVGELQNPAIRDRHWEQLMQATQVKFVMSEETNLADLLALNLHNFEDEVSNGAIV